MNHLLIALISAIVYFVVGSIWYSTPLFGALWRDYANIRASDIEKASMLFLMGSSFLCMLLLSIFLIFHLKSLGENTLLGNTWAMLKLAIGLGAPLTAIPHLYQLKAWQAWAIDAAYMVVGFLLIGITYTLLA